MPGALALLSRAYAVPAVPFRVRTEDGVTIHGHRLGGGDLAVVLCHGFLGWHRKPQLVRFQERVAEAFTVYAFDFRGHGASGGASTFGVREVADIEAVVRLARRERAARVVTFGGSMGAIAVIRHAALVGGVEGVVSVSSPATWDGHESRAVRRMVWLTASPSGRRLLRAGGVRVARDWERAEDPADLVGKIGPAPLVLVHGRDDHFFDVEHAWLLYRRASVPKRLLLAAPFGHAEDGYTPAFAERMATVVRSVVG